MFVKEALCFKGEVKRICKFAAHGLIYVPIAWRSHQSVRIADMKQNADAGTKW